MNKKTKLKKKYMEHFLLFNFTYFAVLTIHNYVTSNLHDIIFKKWNTNDQIFT